MTTRVYDPNKKIIIFIGGKHGPLISCSTLVEPDHEALRGLNRRDDGKNRVFTSKHEVYLRVTGKHEVSVKNLQFCRV